MHVGEEVSVLDDVLKTSMGKRAHVNSYISNIRSEIFRKQTQVTVKLTAG